jgi:hypothetical protein
MLFVKKMHGASNSRQIRPEAFAPATLFKGWAKGRCGAFLGLILAGSSGPAFAQDSITISVDTTVMPTCAISNPNGFLFLGELSKPGSVAANFFFSCNTNFRFRFSSRHGGLQEIMQTKVALPFVSLVPFTLTYKIGTGSGLLVDQCSSSNMIGLATTCSGASASDTAAIHQTASIGFSWDLRDRIPLAGFYHDVVTFHVDAGL